MIKSDFPDIEFKKVEGLTNRSAMKADGVNLFPALVHGDKVLSGFLLTPGGMRKFLEAV